MDIPQAFDRELIKSLIPHREPFLLVDRVTAWKREAELWAERDILKSDPVFQGHFPGFPVYPGVLQCEAIAQTACILAMASFPEYRRKQVLLMGFSNVKFRKPAIPDVSYRMHVQVIQRRGEIFRFKGNGSIGSDRAVELELTATMAR